MNDQFTEILTAVRFLFEAGSVRELRVLRTKNGTVSGYFDDAEKLAREVLQWDGKGEGVYMTLNPVNPDLLARADNQVKPYAKYATKDSDIVARRFFLIDVDPVRPAGISSTDGEWLAALDRAGDTWCWLKEKGWPDPFLASSGNGFHLLCRADLPNDLDSTKLLKACLSALAFLFSDRSVRVDEATWNAAQLAKVYGTKACKGDSRNERRTDGRDSSKPQKR